MKNRWLLSCSFLLLFGCKDLNNTDKVCHCFEEAKAVEDRRECYRKQMNIARTIKGSEKEEFLKSTDACGSPEQSTSTAWNK